VLLHCFAVCAPGLEPFLAAELKPLGVRVGRADRGGVPFKATTRQLYAANLWLSVASRVLVRIGEFPAGSWEELEAGLKDLPWDAFCDPGTTVRFRVSSSRSRLYHSDAIAERAHRWLGYPPTAEGQEPGQSFVVRIVGNQAVVSVDASGEGLHRRGWRLEVGKAPLRETLAAALLTAAGWNGTVPLLDPFCGSGTIAIEAALRARRVAPGDGRGFAFFDWPHFEPGTWGSVTGAAAAGVLQQPGVAIVASDRDAGVVEAARANAERAGVDADVTVVERSVSAVTRPDGPPGWVVTNPPYGGRVGGPADLRNLYARFGDVVRTELAGWQVCLLTAAPALAGHAGLRFESVLSTSNGGIPVQILRAAAPD
jgi:putative N6-adenine-specific DNA methylase